MSNNELVIRAATTTDVKAIHELTRLLAEHGDDLDHFVASEADMQRALFAERAVTECVLACVDGEPVGCAVFCPKYASYTGRTEIYLEDLIVRPSHRGQGIGRALLSHVARLAKERGATRVEWFVDTTNRRAIDFYERIGARTSHDIAVMRLAGDELTAFIDE